MTARQNLLALLAVRGGGGRRFASVDTAAAHHELNTEQKLSFVRLIARRRAFLRGTWGGGLAKILNFTAKFLRRLLPAV